MFWNLVNPGYGPIALNEGVGDIIRSIFADGTDGFYFDFSKTDRLFQTTTGGSLADSAGENIALALEGSKWGGSTLSQVLAVQTEKVTNGDFSDGTTGWTGNSISVSSGQLTGVSSGASNVCASQAVSVTVGKSYYITWDVISVNVGTGSFIGIGGVATPIQSGAGSRSAIITAISTAGLNVFGSGISTSVTVDNFSVKEIPGNHGLQATTAAQPKWQTGGLARFDGSDDNLLTTLVPGGIITLAGKLKPTSGSRFFFGSQTAPTTRAALSIGAGGLAVANFGSSNTLTGGPDIRGTDATVFGVCDGTDTFLYVNNVLVASEARVGTINTTIPILLGGTNNNGTAAGFADVDFYKALAIKKALTAAEIAAITNLWGTS